MAARGWTGRIERAGRGALRDDGSRCAAGGARLAIDMTFREKGVPRKGMRAMQIFAVNPAVHANAEEPLMGPRVMLLAAATAAV